MGVEKDIQLLLKKAFDPDVLLVENESHMHNVPINSETHFKVTLVSESFVDERSVKRHQAVYAVLAESVSGPVHALALHTYSPAEWSNVDRSPDSPACKGGSGL